MARACPALISPAARLARDGAGELQEAEGVGDAHPALAHPLGHRRLRKLRFADQPLVGLRLFQRGEVLALDVLHQGEGESVALGGVADDDGHFRQAGQLGRPPASLAGDEHVAGVGRAADQDRLEDAVLTDAGRELLQAGGLEMGARLLRVGPDRLDRQRGRRGGRGDRRGRRGDQRVQAAAEGGAGTHRRAPGRAGLAAVGAALSAASGGGAPVAGSRRQRNSVASSR